MNKKSLITVVLILLPLSIILGWGAEGHKLISNKAMDLLPQEMSGFTNWQKYITIHSVDPDLRRDHDKSEAPKHYIDIDFYPEFLNGKMIEDKSKLVAEYGDSTVTKMGLLPWATLNTYNELVDALKEKNKDKALLYASDLGHYVADGHQPMHTIMNYNGQMTGQKGIHGRYESVMVDSNLTEINRDFHAEHATYVKHPLHFIFNYITDANSVVNLLFDADTYAYKMAKSRDDHEYYRLLWFKTKYITETQIENAARDFASLFYSAWVDAGKPAFDEFK
jgi:hypothetical protein